MSDRIPRSVEDGQFDLQTGNTDGNTDNQNKLVDMQAIRDQLDRLRAPLEEPTLDESLPALWKKDNNKRILARIKATTSDMDDFLKKPETIRLFSPQGSLEQRQSDYIKTMERVETLRQALQMAKDDVRELSESYLPGVDSDGLGRLIVNLKAQIQLLEDICSKHIRNVQVA
ncbi:uncharacterized protein NECHADRAFT_78321 [Fusarium vanettenii 77-13-4]|uniref:Uncharacterized protein n=1 Tax=Fusarium vanettenii (strain ATCC MYA-4622 / CBS 123669 / FGSC 9596 / NRRL 45880 / 77-13-4) TaxID=660122 RepID=C7ZFH1_FUSV7|nr:uncharacterized protein NECHADRAFT_78321 [Fusarium vanettenii 77-13-4]EEU37149.1 predicted protein [Fusarium vanettenii 77-13-4]